MSEPTGKLLYNEDDIKAELTKNARRVAESAQKNKKVGRIIVIKVRYSDFSTLTKRMTLDKSTQDSTPSKGLLIPF